MAQGPQRRSLAVSGARLRIIVSTDGKKTLLHVLAQHSIKTKHPRTGEKEENRDLLHKNIIIDD